MEYNRPTSYSQNEMFETCPRTWYMKYVQKIPGIEDLVYAHRGNVVHHCLEKYYKNKIESVQKFDISDIKEEFEKDWDKFKLYESKLKNKKDETWLMILNGINLNINPTSLELKIFYPDVVGYLDVVDTRNKIVMDWKTSTISDMNKKSYIRQLKFYSWLYYRKFNELLNEVKIYYLKYNGSRSELSYKPTMADIKEMEKWHFNIREQMNYYITNPDKLPDFNQDYFFCPYKHLWDIQYVDSSKIMNFVIHLYGNFFYIKGDVDEFLDTHFDNKYSYELKNAYFIKKNNPNANTIIKLYSKKLTRLPIGFLDETMKSLNDYAEFRNKIPIIKINDNRCFDNTIVNMPDKLLSGKTLRPYQQDAVDTYVNRYKVGILELTTGAGKSLIMTEIIRLLNMKTLIVIDKRELLYQLKEILETNLGFDIGIIGDGKKEIKNITVATIQTLIKNINDFKEYLGEVRLLIMDECHHASSNSYYKLGSLMPNTEYRCGFSGTAYRDDGNELMMFATLGRIAYSLTGQQLINDGYLMRPEIYFIKYNVDDITQKELEFNASNGLMNEEPNYALHYNSFIVNNKKRNDIIKEICDKHSGDTILILVKLIDHGKILESLIPNSKYVYGKTKKQIRTDMLTEFKSGNHKILISTISIFSEGVDIPNLDVIINASANKGDVKSVQVLGRVLRKNDNKVHAYYYDFYDNDSFLKNASISRQKIFRNNGHEVLFK